MDIVLDTVSMNHICRGKTSSDSGKFCQAISARTLRVVIDKDRALFDEWAKTVNLEALQQLLISWSDMGGVVTLKKDCKLSRELANALHKLSFTDTGDKLVVRIAICTTDRTIVSEDSDFWDPRDSSKRGNRNAPVATTLWDLERIRVTTLGELAQVLEA
jgi:hypothetical protein